MEFSDTSQQQIEDPISLPVLLSSAHNLAGFDCGKAPLNDFLVKYAQQNQASGGARTYVLTRGKPMIGYYSLAPASVAPENASARVLKEPRALSYTSDLDGAFRAQLERTRQRLRQNHVSRCPPPRIGWAEAIGGSAFLMHVYPCGRRSPRLLCALRHGSLFSGSIKPGETCCFHPCGT
jgi:hypothetical protein